MRTFRELYEQKQMRIVMLGGPGSGKSTYTEYLIRHFQINHIYPGGMLRKEVEKNSEIGQRVKDIISKGQFVPNQIVLDLIKAEVVKSPNGYVLFLDVSREEVMNRLLARGRVDDTREIINNRIDLYKKETGPVVEYFREKPGFIQIRAEGEPDIIGKEIIQRIENEGK